MSPMPRRMPDEVRERMRAKVMGDLDGAAAQRRVPFVLAVAATVAVLAGAVAVVTTPEATAPANPTSSPTTTDSAPEAVLDAAVAKADLDRCWAQVLATGRTHQYPDRARWKPVFTTIDYGRRVTAARADGMPLFCATTLTSVAVSEPKPVARPPEAPTPLFTAPGGVVAGLAPDHLVILKFDGRNRTIGTIGPVSDGMFAVIVGAQDPREIGPLEVNTDEGPQEQHWELRGLPSPALAVVDKPEVAPDRTTELGATVAKCVNRPGDGGPVFDAPSWRAGVLSPAIDGKRHLVIYNSHLVTACSISADGSVGFPMSPSIYMDRRSAKRFMPAVVDQPREGGAVLAGWVAPEVARMEIDAGGRTLTPTIANQAFVLVDLLLPSYDIEVGELRLYDKAGALIHKGTLREPA